MYERSCRRHSYNRAPKPSILALPGCLLQVYGITETGTLKGETEHAVLTQGTLSCEDGHFQISCMHASNNAQQVLKLWYQLMEGSPFICDQRDARREGG